MSQNGEAVRASGLGDTVRTIRKGSQHRDMVAFAVQAGISKEGLRKIESGERLPNRETLENILRAGSVPKKRALELQQLRDTVQAKRDGLDVPTYANDVDLERLATISVGTLIHFLKDEIEIGKDDQRYLVSQVTKALRKALT